MDCSSPYAMASLIKLKDKFDIAFGNDPDVDRHGIVTRSAGLLNPNHYLAVAIWYLFQHRPGWRKDAAVGKTLVSSSMIDRVAAHLGRTLVRSAGGLQVVRGWAAGWLVRLWRRGKRGRVVPAPRRHGVDHGQGRHHPGSARRRNHRRRPDATRGSTTRRWKQQFGSSAYERMDVPATPEQKAVLNNLSPEMVEAARAGRRKNHRQAHPRAGQQRAHRRAESGHGERLVCGAALRHGEHLQGLCGEL